MEDQEEAMDIVQLCCILKMYNQPYLRKDWKQNTLAIQHAMGKGKWTFLITDI